MFPSANELTDFVCEYILTISRKVVCIFHEIKFRSSCRHKVNLFIKICSNDFGEILLDFTLPLRDPTNDVGRHPTKIPGSGIIDKKQN